MTLIPVDIKIGTEDDGIEVVTVTGEATDSPHFAITPGVTRRDGNLILTGGNLLTHIPTGRWISNNYDHNFNRLIAAIEPLCDWSKPDFAPTPDESKAIRQAIFDAGNVDTSWPWPEWAGDESAPALSVLVQHLDDAMTYTEFARKVRTEIRTEVGTHDESLAGKVDSHLQGATIGMYCESYGVIWLLAVLLRVAPEAADAAAKELVSAWEAGELSEWIYQWRDEIGKGKPLTLHGIPDAPVDGWF